MSSSEKIEFLLDENVSHSLKNLINSKGSKAITLQDLNKRGIKNSKNSILLKLARKLFLSDFEFYNSWLMSK